MKKYKALIFLIGFLVAVGVSYGLQTPSYALFRIVHAAESRDLATFYSYMNLPAVIDSIEDAENTRRISKEAKSEWQALSQTVQTNISKILKPKQQNLLEREIEGRFRKTQLPDAADETFGHLLATRNFFREVESFQVGSVARRGEEALANLEVELPRLKKSYALLLVLQKGDRWQISGLEGLASTLDEYARDQQIHLQAYNEQVAKKLSEALSCKALIKRESQLLGLQKALIWELNCTNLQPDTIVTLIGRIKLSNAAGKVLKEFPLKKTALSWASMQPLTFTQTESIGLFDNQGGKAFAEADIRADFITEELQFGSQAVLRPAQRYEETR